MSEDLGHGRIGTIKDGVVYLEEEPLEGMLEHEDKKTDTFRIRPYGFLKGIRFEFPEKTPNFDASNPYYVTISIYDFRKRKKVQIVKAVALVGPVEDA